MPTPKNSLYQRAGIDDIAEFYRTKFVSDEVLDARYFKALDRFDIRFARTMWGLSARADWSVPGGEFTSITAYRESQSADVSSARTEVCSAN